MSAGEFVEGMVGAIDAFRSPLLSLPGITGLAPMPGRQLGVGAGRSVAVAAYLASAHMIFISRSPVAAEHN